MPHVSYRLLPVSIIDAHLHSDPEATPVGGMSFSTFCRVDLSVGGDFVGCWQERFFEKVFTYPHAESVAGLRVSLVGIAVEKSLGANVSKALIEVAIFLEDGIV